MFLESNSIIFPKWAPKVFINDRFYKEMVIVFRHFFGLRFLTGKVMIRNFAQMQQEIVKNVMLFGIKFCHFSQIASKSLRKRQVL